MQQGRPLFKGRYSGYLLSQHQRVHARGALEGADGLQVAEMPDNLIILAHKDTPGVSNNYFLSLEAVNIITANFILFLKFVGRASESFQPANAGKSPASDNR